MGWVRLKLMKLSIVIVNWNTCDLLLDCLSSICDPPLNLDFKAIVVDNASRDETVSFIETNYPEITLLKQIENLGFGQANNIGISYALNQGAEHIFLLNVQLRNFLSATSSIFIIELRKLFQTQALRILLS